MNVRIGVLLVPLLVPLLLLSVWLAWWSPTSRRPLQLDPSHRSALLAGHRKAAGWRWAGLGLGGVVVGELTTIPRRQGVRTAALETRTIGDYLPRRLGGLVAASALGLGALLVTTTLMGSADDQGRAGRNLFRLCSPERSESAGPWPGSFYSVPLGIAVVVGLLGAALALRTVVLRPRSGSDPDLVAGDDVLRRRSAEAVTAATGVMVAASLSGVALVAAGALMGFGCAPASWTILGIALLAVGALMLLLTAWCLALLLAGRRLPPGGVGRHGQLAGDLGLAVGTVARTYRELEAAGLVRSRRGGGTRVALTVPKPSAGERQVRLAALAAAYVMKARALGASDAEITAAVLLDPHERGRPLAAQQVKLAR